MIAISVAVSILCQASAAGPRASAAASASAQLVARASPMSMAATAPIDVVVTATADGVAADRWIAVTRGISFAVETMDGKGVVPEEPPPFSPPPPPPPPSVGDPGQITSVIPGRPLVIRTAELSRWLFPGPGTYRIRAAVRLFGPAGAFRVVSLPTTVRVER